MPETNGPVLADLDDQALVGFIDEFEGDIGGPVVPSNLPDYLRLKGVRLHAQDAQRLQAVSARTWANRHPEHPGLPATERFDDMAARNQAAYAAAHPKAPVGTLETLRRSVGHGIARLGVSAARLGLGQGFGGRQAELAMQELDRRSAELSATSATPVAATVGEFAGQILPTAGAGLLTGAATKAAPVLPAIRSMALLQGAATGGEAAHGAEMAGASPAGQELAAGIGALGGYVAGRFMPGIPGAWLKVLTPAAKQPPIIKAMAQVATQSAANAALTGASRDVGIELSADGVQITPGQFLASRAEEAALGAAIGPVAEAGSRVPGAVYRALRRPAAPVPAPAPVPEVVAPAAALPMDLPPMPGPEALQPPAPVPVPRARPEDVVPLLQTLQEERMLAREDAFPPEVPYQQARELEFAPPRPAPARELTPDEGLMQALRYGSKATVEDLLSRTSMGRAEIAGAPSMPTWRRMEPEAPAGKAPLPRKELVPPEIVEQIRANREAAMMEAQPVRVSAGERPVEVAAKARERLQAEREIPTARIEKPAAIDESIRMPAEEVPRAQGLRSDQGGPALERIVPREGEGVRGQDRPGPAEEARPAVDQVEPAPVASRDVLRPTGTKTRQNLSSEKLASEGSAAVFKVGDRYAVGTTSTAAARTARRRGSDLVWRQKGGTFPDQATAEAAMRALPEAKHLPPSLDAPRKRGVVAKVLKETAVDQAVLEDPKLRAELEAPEATAETLAKVRAEALSTMDPGYIRAIAAMDEAAPVAEAVGDQVRAVHGDEVQMDPAAGLMAQEPRVLDRALNDLRDATELHDAGEMTTKDWHAELRRQVTRLRESPDAVDQALSAILKDFQGQPKDLADRLNRTVAEVARVTRTQVLAPELTPTEADGMTAVERSNVLRNFAHDLGLPVPRIVKGLTAGGRKVNGATIGNELFVNETDNVTSGIAAIAHEHLHRQVLGLDEAGKADLTRKLAELQGIPGIEALDKTLAAMFPQLKDAPLGSLEEAVADAAAKNILTNRNNILEQLAPKTQTFIKRAMQVLAKAIKKLLARFTGIENVNPRAMEGLANLAEWLQRWKPMTAEEQAAWMARRMQPALDLVEAGNALRGDLGNEFGQAIAKVARLAGEDLGSAAGKAGKRLKIAAWDDLFSAMRRIPGLSQVDDSFSTAAATASKALEPLREAREALANTGPAEDRILKIMFDNRANQLRRRLSGENIEPEAAQWAWMRKQGLTDKDVPLAKRLYQAMEASRQALRASMFAEAHVPVMTDAELAARIQAADPDLRTLETLQNKLQAFDEATKDFGYVPLDHEGESGLVAVVDEDSGVIDPANQIRLPIPMSKANDRAWINAELKKLSPNMAADSYRIENRVDRERVPMEQDFERTVNRMVGRAGLTDEQATEVRQITGLLRPALVEGRMAAHMLRAKGVKGYRTDAQVLQRYATRLESSLRAAHFFAAASDHLSKIAASGKAENIRWTQKHVESLFTNDTSEGAGAARALRGFTAIQLLSSPIQAVQSVGSKLVWSPFRALQYAPTGRALETFGRAVADQMKNIVLLAPEAFSSAFITMRNLARRGSHATGYERMVALTKWLDSKAASTSAIELHAKALEKLGSRSTAEAIRRTNLETDLFADVHARDIARRPLDSAVRGAWEHVVAGLTWFNSHMDRMGVVADFAAAHRMFEQYTPSDWKWFQERHPEYLHGTNPEMAARFMADRMSGARTSRTRPLAFRGKWGSALGMLTSYALNQTKLFAAMVRDPFRTTPSRPDRQLWQLVAPLGAIGMFTALAGIRKGFPGLDPLVAIWQSIMMEEGKNVDEEMRQYAEANAGTATGTLAKLWSRGAGQAIPGKGGRWAEGMLEQAAPRGLILEKAASIMNLAPAAAVDRAISGGQMFGDGVSKGNADLALMGAARMTGVGPENLYRALRSGEYGLAPKIPVAAKDPSSILVGQEPVIKAQDLGLLDRVLTAAGVQNYQVRRVSEETRALTQARQGKALDRDLWVADMVKAVQLPPADRQPVVAKLVSDLRAEIEPLVADLRQAQADVAAGKPGAKARLYKAAFLLRPYASIGNQLRQALIGQLYGTGGGPTLLDAFLRERVDGLYHP